MLYVQVDLYAQERAVFLQPITDIFFEKLSRIFPEHTMPAIYFSSSFSSRNKYECPRAAQALFNEVVSIERQEGNEVLIERPHVFFQNNGNPISAYWVLKHSLVTFDELLKKKIDLTVFPEPINYQNPDTIKARNIITLILPWHYNGINFSVGTRFIRTFKDSKTQRGIKFYDPTSETVIEASVPKSHALVFKNQSAQDHQKLFIQLLHLWLSQPGVIPYVWGGYSIREFLNSNQFEEHFQIFNDTLVSEWMRPTLRAPYSGIDCSGLVSLAAQIAGIPYFYKNTYTLSQNLEPLSPQDTLEEGDLLWFNGHVMIVSNIPDNLIIEAAGYRSGFGQVQEIALNKRFQDIQNYKDLFTAYLQKKELKICNNQGQLFITIPHFVLYKLASVWKRTPNPT